MSKERLETIKEFVKKIESILYDEWRQQELTILIESLYYADHVDWLINRVEDLEETNKKLIESATVVANENHRYKLALEFYANKKNYDLKQLERDKHVIPIFEDKGKKARQALGWEEGK